MKVLSLALAVWLSWPVLTAISAGTPAVPRLPKKQDLFFIENDFAYQRFLLLARDGTYRQINRERTVAAEVDRGTWEQDATGTVLLHFTHGGLRFHTLLSGPLAITLDNPQNFAALPTAANAIRRWLALSSNTVFAADNAPELGIAPFFLTVDPKAESFRRADLESLARQMDDFVWSEQHRTFRLTPFKTPDGPVLLVQPGAVFQPADLERVQGEYKVAHGQPPPFYFAQVSPGTFAHEAGSWQEGR